ncbi:hypothetical protein SEA_TYPHA_47 [Mycobacterium phage Typha]|uniref:Uncharacterized protein n=1 Tax=Mycobacterium phage Typha TaxID=2517971 RepID=A0A482JDL9_9CAUD|nr:hypothetical protein KCH40_gp122 [Mycobacterium phage Typha]QBP29702.1 hypothetical protein SEA_TYPHA_47 [Mycobacterium phage Typha]
MDYGPGDGKHYDQPYWVCPNCMYEVHPDDDEDREHDPC